MKHRYGARHAFGLGLVSVLLLGAGSARADGAVTIVRPVEFKQGATARDAVKQECQLQTKVPDYIKQYADESFSVSFAESADAAKGRVLVMTIASADEFGNAWTGRQKAMTVEGELRENGKVIGTITARRTTMGGAFAGYKGNCSFFHRCSKALGKDVAEWLKAPAMNTVLSN